MSRDDINDLREARINPPTRRREDRDILDIDHYAPFLLNAVSNAWSRNTSAVYRREFGLSLLDWRIISMLNIEPGITASRICDVIRLDKAAVSRALRQLMDKDLLEIEQASTDPRKRLWWLSEAGQKVHEAMLATALSFESELVSGIPARDLDTFLRVMRRMLTNIDPK